MRNSARNSLQFFILLGMIAFPFYVFADNSSDLAQQIAQKKGTIAQIQKQIDDYNRAIAIKQKEAVTLKNQLDIVDTRIERTQLEIKQASDEIDATKQQMQLTGLAISDKQTDIANRKQWISSLLRSIHSDDQVSTLELLLTHQSVSDVINQKEYSSELQKNIVQGMHELQDAKVKLDSKLTEQEDHKKQLDKYQTQMTDKKYQLVDEKNNKTQLITETKSSEKKFMTLVDQLKQQSRQIEAEEFALEEQQRLALKKQGKLAQLGSFAPNWPVPSHYVTTRFHDPDYPFRHIFEHPGLDIRAGQGTQIHAAAAGYVGTAKDAGFGYSYIILIHGGGYATVYGHVSSIYVKPGQYVDQGDVIGLSGGTPGSRGAGPFVTGAHLHFEVRKDGIPIDPLPYLQ